MIRLHALLVCTLMLVLGRHAQAQIQHTIFHSVSDSIYRIPALASTSQGRIVALSDHRHTHGSDVGWGRPIDILCRTSQDEGKTWSPSSIAADCSDSTYAASIYGFGDASIVCDRESDRLLMLCVGDSLGKSYFDRAMLQVHSFESLDGGISWHHRANLTQQIYALNPEWRCLFIASGRIFQSRVIKRGSHYRLYCVAAVADFGNAVFYSDDFGDHWAVLGDPTLSPCPKGDEAKVEELPDGTLILSSRTQGRYFNLFHFEGRYFQRGHWGEPALARDIICLDNACNGEILALKAIDKQSGHRVWLFLQSVPAGPGRRNVSLYYKALPCKRSYRQLDAPSFGENWSRYQISSVASAYSTLCLTNQGLIGCLYESECDVNGYDIVYRTLSLEEITSGRYTNEANQVGRK